MPAIKSKAPVSTISDNTGFIKSFGPRYLSIIHINKATAPKHNINSPNPVNISSKLSLTIIVDTYNTTAIVSNVPPMTIRVNDVCWRFLLKFLSAIFSNSLLAAGIRKSVINQNATRIGINASITIIAFRPININELKIPCIVVSNVFQLLEMVFAAESSNITLSCPNTPPFLVNTLRMSIIFFKGLSIFSNKPSTILTAIIVLIAFLDKFMMEF